MSQQKLYSLRRKQVCKYRYTIPSMNNLHECIKCRAEMKYGKHINKEEDTELHKNNTEHIIHEQKNCRLKSGPGTRENF